MSLELTPLEFVGRICYHLDVALEQILETFQGVREAFEAHTDSSFLAFVERITKDPYERDAERLLAQGLFNPRVLASPLDAIFCVLQFETDSETLLKVQPLLLFLAMQRDEDLGRFVKAVVGVAWTQNPNFLIDDYEKYMLGVLADLGFITSIPSEMIRRS